MPKCAEILEFKKISDEILSYSHSEIGKALISSLTLIRNKEALINELAATDEMMSVLLRHGSLPIDNSKDLSSIIDLAIKGGVLTPLDLESVAHDVLITNKVAKYFNVFDKEYPTLKSKSKDFVDLSILETKIHSIIRPDLEIYDNASPKLNGLRSAIKKKEIELNKVANRLLNKYKDYLNGDNITIRDGHYVLPIKTSYKNKLLGLVFDVSETGLTTFIEPQEILFINNEIISLKNEEREEIKVILIGLTKEVIAYKDDVVNNNKIIGYFDFVSSKAIYGNNHEAYVASVSDNNVIELKNARHPLINKDQVVPNTFILNKDTRIMLLSGPNAGGKSVAIKTVGILVYMHQCGLPILTSEKAELSFFRNIYVDIGDNQSISENLSTFAAHVSSLAAIIDNARSNDLILLDEIGTGTSPKEGEALAIAITSYMLSKGFFGIITSHFDGLKIYAINNPGIINASMMFDNATLLPTYKINVGVPGRSYGLEMAGRYHLKASIITRAKELLSNEHTGIDDTLARINEVLSENEKLQAELKKQKHDLSVKENDARVKLDRLKKEEENLVNKFNEKHDKLLLETKEKLEALYEEVNHSNVKPHEITKALNDIKEEDIDAPFVNEEEIKLGDYVAIDSLGVNGKVSRINGDKIDIISNDGFTYKTNKNKVRLSVAPIINKVHKSNRDYEEIINTTLKTEVNVIGQHVDEALLNVERYLDNARLKRLKTVRIIHGNGTGALKKAIRSYLEKCSFIDSYHAADLYDGGEGATIVNLK